MSETTTPKLFEELDYRESNGIEVWLLWARGTGDVVVFVADEKTNESFQITTDGRDPLEVFRHPYAYRGCGGAGEPVPATGQAQATT